MDSYIVLQSATVALFVLEGIKFIARKVLGNPDFTFAPLFYTLLIPFLTAGAGVGLGLLGWAPAVAFEPMAFVQWAVAIAMELALYHMGVEPYKQGRADYREGYLYGASG